jgi:TATA-box binding protein (TBP) (component of TFIID and TFIIIB)
MVAPKVVILIYVSGKVSITGGKVRMRLSLRRLAPWPAAAG